MLSKAGQSQEDKYCRKSRHKVLKTVRLRLKQEGKEEEVGDFYLIDIEFSIGFQIYKVRKSSRNRWVSGYISLNVTVLMPLERIFEEA